MSSGTVFKDNGNQVVRLPVEARFPEDVKKVHVRVIGQERILSPVATQLEQLLSWRRVGFR